MGDFCVSVVSKLKCMLLKTIKIKTKPPLAPSPLSFVLHKTLKLSLVFLLGYIKFIDRMGVLFLPKVRG